MDIEELLRLDAARVGEEMKSIDVQAAMDRTLGEIAKLRASDESDEQSPEPQE